jgi:hypothetical protein
MLKPYEYAEKLEYWYYETPYQYTGLRFQDEPMTVGEVIDHKSHVWNWDTDEDTGIELPGLCVLSRTAVEQIRYYGWMKHCAIVGYDDMEYDQEYGDHIAKNPVVLEVLK